MSYVVKEVFWTLQGEGLNVGTAAIFVRFVGCNMWDGTEQGRSKGIGSCAKWCDTNFVGGITYSLEALLTAVMTTASVGDARWVVLTGGEPTLQLDHPLIDGLHRLGFKVAIETNGARFCPAIYRCDHVCLSPKRGSDWSASQLRGRADEIKIVYPGGVDGDGWTREDLRRIEIEYPTSELFLQAQDPLDGPVPRERFDDVLAFIARHPRWRLSLQTHKLIGLP